jgi:hypothetical protein
MNFNNPGNPDYIEKKLKIFSNPWQKMDSGEYHVINFKIFFTGSVNWQRISNKTCESLNLMKSGSDS